MTFDPNFRGDVRALQRRIQGMLQRGTVKSVDDAMKLQILDLEVHHGFAPTKVEHAQPYGFHFHPLPGAEVLVGALGGNQDHLAVLGTFDRRHRPKSNQPGEVQIYSHDGQTVTLKNGKIIELKTGASTITMDDAKTVIKVGSTEIIAQNGSLEFKASAVKHTQV